MSYLSLRRTWMWQVRKMQERFSADVHGCGKCGKCRSDFQPTYMDVASAENAGAFFPPSTWMWEMQVLHKQISAC